MNGARDAYAARVWATLEADPEFNARMERGRADIEAGRVVLFRDAFPRRPRPARVLRRGAR